MNPENEALERLILRSGSISIIRLLHVAASRWYWIAGSAAIALLAGIVCRETIAPRYEADITLRFLDRQSELDDLRGKAASLVLWRTPKEYLAAKYHINSPELLGKALERMDHPFSFREIRHFRRIDVYPFRPLVLEVLSYDEARYENGTFRMDDTLRILYTAKSRQHSIPLEENQPAEVPGLCFIIRKITEGPGFPYEFVFEPPEQKALGLSGSVALQELEENLPIMRLSFRSSSESFSKDFLASLTETYQDHTLLEKQAASLLTLRFIEEQKKVFSDSLRQAAREIETFRQTNALHDPGSFATEISLKLRELERDRRLLALGQSLTGLAGKKDAGTAEEIMAGLEASADAALIKLAEQYRQTAARREELLLRYSENAPPVRVLDHELQKISIQAVDNLRLREEKTGNASAFLDSLLEQYTKSAGELPALEKDFLYLQGRFDVNRDIYSLLSNKAIESAIANAGVLPAFTPLTPVEVRRLFPTDGQLIALFLLAGISAGLGLVFLKRSTAGTFRSLEQIAPHERITWSGIIPRLSPGVTGTEKDLARLAKDRSLFTERINALRTKVVFSKSSLPSPQGGKLLAVTSEQAGEGKSFLVLNMALSLTRIDKKVLVIGCDLRRPKTGPYLSGGPPDCGLSDWLEREDLPMGKIIYRSPAANLDYIPAGTPPLFPGELLQKEKIADLIRYARLKYDYILLDTAPAGLVADNIPLLPLCDHVLYCVRWLYSRQDAHRLAVRLAIELDIPQIMIVLNNYYRDRLYDSLSPLSALPPEYPYYYRDYSGSDRTYFRDSRTV